MKQDSTESMAHRRHRSWRSAAAESLTVTALSAVACVAMFVLLDMLGFSRQRPLWGTLSGFFRVTWVYFAVLALALLFFARFDKPRSTHWRVFRTGLAVAVPALVVSAVPLLLDHSNTGWGVLVTAVFATGGIYTLVGSIVGALVSYLWIFRVDAQES